MGTYAAVVHFSEKEEDLYDFECVTHMHKTSEEDVSSPVLTSELEIKDAEDENDSGVDHTQLEVHEDQYEKKIIDDEFTEIGMKYEAWEEPEEID